MTCGHQDKLQVQVARLLDEPTAAVVGWGIRLLLPGSSEIPQAADAQRGADQFLRAIVRNQVKELHSSTLVIWQDALDRGQQIQ